MANVSTTHKRGTTLSLTGLFPLPAGTWTATSNLEQPDGTLIQALAVTLTPLSAPDSQGNTHSALLYASAEQTATWPAIGLLCDIRFSDASVPSVVLSTETFYVTVEKEVT